MNKSLIVYPLIGILALLYWSCNSSRESTGSDLEKLKEVKPVTSTFKLLSINTMHSLNDRREVAKFAAWVKGTGADVVTVQEIERATDSKPGFDAVTELSKQLDMRSHFGKARYYKGWDSGNALFSPYPIMQTNVYSLPVGKGKVRRSLTYGVVDMGLHQLGFCSTQLDDETLGERMKQVGEICSLAKSLGDYPMVVSGDFGENGTGKASEKMLGTFSNANSLNDHTQQIDEQTYVVSGSKVMILSAERTGFTKSMGEGLLVTLKIFQ